MQNSLWLNKIENWKWTAVNTKTYSNSGPNYWNSLTATQIYLHEMNRSTKTSTVGEWTYPEDKIGLIYASDYVLSLGNVALDINTGTYDNRNTYNKGWIYQSNNDISLDTFEWIMLHRGYNSERDDWNGWLLSENGSLDASNMYYNNGVRPVFYLTSDTTISGGMGTYSEPFIIG